MPQLSHHIQSSKPNAKNLSQAASKNFGEDSHGHEYIIDHPRRDIFVRRVWLLWARALVLNGRHGGTQSAFISEGNRAMVKPTVEKMVNGNADALAKERPSRREDCEGPTTTRSA
jgi:hypothetical protein